MYEYLSGMVTKVNPKYIVLDNSGIGYLIYVPNPYNFKVNDYATIWVYQAVREDSIDLYGFATFDEKEFFLKLISVTGIGPKSALAMLSKSDYNNLIEAIETGNLGYLKKLPGIGPKAAGQIILDLKGHLRVDVTVVAKENPVFKEAKEALKGFGFKAQEIDNALAKIQDENIEVSDCIFKALQFLNRK